MKDFTTLYRVKFVKILVGFLILLNFRKMIWALQLKKNGTTMQVYYNILLAVDDFKTIRSSKLDMVAKSQLDQIDLDLGLGDDDNED